MFIANFKHLQLSYTKLSTLICSASPVEEIPGGEIWPVTRCHNISFKSVYFKRRLHVKLLFGKIRSYQRCEVFVWNLTEKKIPGRAEKHNAWSRKCCGTGPDVLHVVSHWRQKDRVRQWEWVVSVDLIQNGRTTQRSK